MEMPLRRRPDIRKLEHGRGLAKIFWPHKCSHERLGAETFEECKITAIQEIKARILLMMGNVCLRTPMINKPSSWLRSTAEIAANFRA